MLGLELGEVRRRRDQPLTDRLAINLRLPPAYVFDYSLPLLRVGRRGPSPLPCRTGYRPRARSPGRRVAPGAGRGRSCRRSSATTNGPATTTVRCGSGASRRPGAPRTPQRAEPMQSGRLARSPVRRASSWSVRAAWARPTRSLNSSSISRVRAAPSSSTPYRAGVRVLLAWGNERFRKCGRIAAASAKVPVSRGDQGAV